MRRVLVTATLGLAFFAAAACADTPMDPAGTPTPGKSVTLADKKATCDAFKKLNADAEAKLTPYFGKFMAAISDPSKVTATDLADVLKLAKEYDTELKTIAAGAGDPEVKAAIDAELVSHEKLVTDLTAVSTDPAKFVSTIMNSDDKATDKVKTLCGIAS